MLKVAVNAWKPFIMAEVSDNGIISYTGMHMDLLDQLARTLNFTYTLMAPRDGAWGEDVEGQWTGVVGMLQR